MRTLFAWEDNLTSFPVIEGPVCGIGEGLNGESIRAVTSVLRTA